MAATSTPGPISTARPTQGPASRISLWVTAWCDRFAASSGFRLGALVGLVAATVAVRIPELRQPLWGDEVSSARAIAHSHLSLVIDSVRFRKTEPPGWYVLMWLIHRSGQLVGHAPSYPALRTVSLLFSVGTVLLVYGYAQRIVGRLAGFGAAAICAFGSEFVLHGAELRSYAMVSFLAIALAVLIQRHLDRPRWWWPVLIALVAALGTYSQYFFLATVVALAVYLWIAGAPASRRLTAGAGLTVGLLAVTPWLPYVVGRLHRYTYIGPYNGHTVVSLPWNLVSGYMHVDPLVRDEQLLLFVTAIVGFWLLFRTPGGRLVVCCGVFPPVLGALVWVAGKPVYDPRNFMAAAPFLGIAIAAPLAKAGSRALRSAIVLAGILALIVAVTQTQLTLGRTAYDAAASAISKAGWRYSDPIVFFGRDTWTMRELTWSLPHHDWMVRTVPPRGTCTDLYAVVENAAGRRWLRSVRSPAPLLTIINYGSAPEGHARAVGIQVVKLTNVSPTALTLARLYRGDIFASAPAPRLTLNAPQPRPYFACGG